MPPIATSALQAGSIWWWNEGLPVPIERRGQTRLHSQAEAYATRRYFPLSTGVNLIFLINSTICPSRTIPDTAVIA